MYFRSAYFRLHKYNLQLGFSTEKNIFETIAARTYRLAHSAQCNPFQCQGGKKTPLPLEKQQLGNRQAAGKFNLRAPANFVEAPVQAVQALWCKPPVNRVNAYAIYRKILESNFTKFTQFFRAGP